MLFLLRDSDWTEAETCSGHVLGTVGRQANTPFCDTDSAWVSSDAHFHFSYQYVDFFLHTYGTYEKYNSIQIMDYCACWSYCTGIVMDEVGMAGRGTRSVIDILLSFIPFLIYFAE